jgi:4-amino-4-deoxychorismate lyase
MYQLFETIKVIDNCLLNIDYHNGRINQARRELFNDSQPWDLRNMVAIPNLNPGTVYKCKVVYDKIIRSVQFDLYSRKPLNRLRLIESNLIYNFKYVDRSSLDLLKDMCMVDEDVIIVQNDIITDCTYANLIFHDGFRWFTPSNPLLKGTKRQKYIDNKIITEKNIHVNELSKYAMCRIINAMIDLDDSQDILIENIIW